MCFLVWVKLSLNDENKVLHVHINFYSIKQLSACLVYNKKGTKTFIDNVNCCLPVYMQRERRNFYIVFKKSVMVKNLTC